MFSVILVAELTPNGSATSPDSLRYLDIAQNIDRGNGIVGTDYSLDNWDRPSFKEQRQWPPLYPILLAITSPNLANVLVSSYLSAGLLFLSALFAYLILGSRSNWFIALISSLLLCLALPMITVYTYAWSETLFIPLLLMAAWASIRYIDDDRIGSRRRHVYLFLTVLFLLLLAYTRYIGIAFCLLLPAIYIQSSRRRKDTLIFLSLTALYGIGIGTMLLGNYLATGSWSGGHGAVSDRTIIENMLDTYSVVLMSMPSSAMVLIVILIVSGVIYAATANIVAFGETQHSSAGSHDLVVLGGIGALYVSALLVLRSMVAFDALDIRLLAPVFPILWIFLILLPLKLSNSGRRHAVVGVVVMFLIFSVSVRGYQQFVSTTKSWKATGHPNLLSNTGKVFMNYTVSEHHNETKALFSRLSNPNVVAVIHKPIVFEFLTGLKSVQIPELDNLQAILNINTLPAGSLMVLTRPYEKAKFSKLLSQHPIKFNYIHLGDTVAIQIPLLMEYKGEPVMEPPNRPKLKK